MKNIYGFLFIAVIACTIAAKKFVSTTYEHILQDVTTYLYDLIK